MEEDREVPLILGRPFLATGRTLIDVQQGKLILRVQDEQVTFDVFEAMKFPSEVHSCFQINTLDRIILETFEERTPLLPLEACLVKSATIEEEDEGVRQCSELLAALDEYLFSDETFKELGTNETPTSVVKKEANKIELKPMPFHLRKKNLCSLPAERRSCFSFLH